MLKSCFYIAKVLLFAYLRSVQLLVISHLNQMFMSSLEVSQTAEFNIGDVKALAKNLKKISSAERKPIGAIPAYWSPEAEGEVKRVLFLQIAVNFQIPDYNDVEKTVEKDTAVMLEVTGETATLITCASTRLVSFFRDFGKEGGAYEVVYTGKMKNKTNNNLSNHFEVYPLSV